MHFINGISRHIIYLSIVMYFFHHNHNAFAQATEVKRFNSPITHDMCTTNTILREDERKKFDEGEVQLVCIARANFGAPEFRSFWINFAKECQKASPNTYNFDKNKHSSQFLGNNSFRNAGSCGWALHKIKLYGIAKDSDFMSEANLRAEKLKMLSGKVSSGDKSARGSLLLEYLDANDNSARSTHKDQQNYYSLLNEIAAEGQADSAYNVLAQSLAVQPERNMTRLHLEDGLRTLANNGHAASALLYAEAKVGRAKYYANQGTSDSVSKSNLRSAVSLANEGISLADSLNQTEQSRRRLRELSQYVGYVKPAPDIGSPNYSNPPPKAVTDEGFSWPTLFLIIVAIFILSKIFGRRVGSGPKSTRGMSKENLDSKSRCIACNATGYITDHSNFSSKICPHCHGQKYIY